MGVVVGVEETGQGIGELSLRGAFRVPALQTRDKRGNPKTLKAGTPKP